MSRSLGGFCVNNEPTKSEHIQNIFIVSLEARFNIMFIIYILPKFP